MKAIFIDGPEEGRIEDFHDSLDVIEFVVYPPCGIAWAGDKQLTPAISKVTYYRSVDRHCSEPDTFHFSVKQQ